MDRLKPEVTTCQTNPVVSPKFFEEMVERALAQKLPQHLRQVETLTSQVETLSAQVENMGRLLSTLAPKVETFGQEVVQANFPEKIMPTVEAVARRVGGLEFEVAKVPQVLLSHQNYLLGLRKGVEVLGKQVEQQMVVVKRGQLEVESLRG